MWREGDWILLRSVYRESVRWAFMHRVLQVDDDSLVVYLPPESPGASMGRDPDGRYLERWVRGDPPRRHRWRFHHVVKLVRPVDAHTLELFWDTEWTFKGWYVNLQTPLTETRFGYDTTDLALDLTVRPDGRWAWKDEDDFAELIALGALSPEDASGVRAVGERVIAALPSCCRQAGRTGAPGRAGSRRPGCQPAGTSSRGCGHQPGLFAVQLSISLCGWPAAASA